MTSRLLRVSFYLTVTLLALLPAKKLFTAETGCLGDQIQATQDEADSVALVSWVAGPQFPREALYLIPHATVCPGESPVVSSHCYRGPPVLS